jgi:TetR/AcrR family acrAB operon transcriptional repressor
MVRRTKDEALATREALLDAAERVFCASGVTSATLGDVASAAGVTRGAVYWHFRDKGELFGAMCSRATLALAKSSRAGSGWRW